MYTLKELDTEYKKVYKNKEECLKALSREVKRTYDMDMFEEEELEISFDKWIKDIYDSKVKELESGFTEIGVMYFYQD